MGRVGHFVFLLVLAGIFWPLACARQHAPSPPPIGTPIVRVRLLVSQQSVTICATSPPTVKTASENQSLRLNIESGAQATIELGADGWRIGGVRVPGRGELTLSPAQEASVSVNGTTYRGSFRFLPTAPASFDVINDVDVDGYLKGVLARELLKSWNEETYRAQAITARTYALFDARTRGKGNSWDVFPDQRSQVYGGFDQETSKSRSAVDDTSGIVLTYGQPGQERIFKAYFESCCGGVTQSAADAFGEAYVVPLSDQNSHGLCNAAPRYSWGPVEISRDELTRRLRAWGARRGRGERDMAMLSRLETQSVNRFNRPIRFVAIDTSGTRYSLNGEELRVAVNSGADRDSPARLYSSFFKIINDPGSDVIRFVEGHGNGHGVGLCQWCSEARADAGMSHEDILLSAFPRARLVRAY